MGKGPFVAGSKVSVYELNEALAPTGRTFTCLINTDDGSFSLPSITLESPYVLLDCNGYYYNEVKGKLSTASLYLSALVKLIENSAVNIIKRHWLMKPH